LSQTGPSFVDQHFCHIRWKHNRAARTGNHLKTLDELAHAKSRQEASERRNKKKGKSKAAGDPGADATMNDRGSSLEGSGAEGATSLPDPKTIRDEMIQHYQRFADSLKGIRGGEPTPELFERIAVNAYGSQVPLSSVAQVVVVSPTLATATCFDPSLAKAVSVAVREKLELNPSVDETDTVQIPMPRPTMESRQKLSHQVHERAEACRKNVRNVRRGAMDVVKKGMAGKLEGVSKDDAFRASQALEDVTDDIIKKVTQAEKEKQAGIMSV
jgi:ribosome recycling factor